MDACLGEGKPQPTRRVHLSISRCCFALLCFALLCSALLGSSLLAHTFTTYYTQILLFWGASFVPAPPQIGGPRLFILILSLSLSLILVLVIARD